ncbi:M50 family metallopeptidase [Ornithinicoccus hortensis]|uniref:Membrane-associated protease RseP (Regulator of RpoE activity) n=1 Tax=Ornithinicoccus hortensis TaxID=82346 RepID=A0A542YRQ4_9MICO|nr:site-2 protease family protein [Ornithinicoccus hortensis]TQL50785.1 membrane-associated protease RseP (regulator of RpoE activity) [Ornithinicoccus hortensis]
MMYLLGVLLMLVGISASIALHELGHLLPAKKFGVKCTQYMVGFGPTLWSRRKGDTEYGVKAIPLGGYVRMIGMFPPLPGQGDRLRPSSTGRFSQLADQARAESAEEILPGDEDRVFYKLPVWKRVVIMLGGPVTNLVIATVLLTGIITVYGIPEYTSKVSTVSACAPADPAATSCEGQPPSPALAAGLEEGDVITAVDGQAVQGWGETSYAIQNATSPATITVDRDGTTRELTVQLTTVDRPLLRPDGTPQLDEAGQPVLGQVSFLGASGSVEYIPQPVSDAPTYVGTALVETGKIFLALPEKMVGVWQAAFGGDDRDETGPISVVGVGRVAGEVTAGGLGALTGTFAAKMVLLLNLLASLNIALFVFNMIPLLPLDGGHVAGALWEGLKRTVARVFGRPDPGPVDIAKALPLAYTVAMVFIGMTVLLVYADLVNPIRLGG